MNTVAAPARALWKPALLVAGVALLGWALRGETGQHALAALEQLGPGRFVLAAALACALGAPRQLTAYAAGVGFGAWAGCALALAAQVLGCAADFVWARAVARGWVAARLRGRMARLDAALAQRPFSATLTVRLLPVGNNLAVNLLAGVSGVAAGPFLAASALGYLPQTLVFALLGSGVHVGREAQLGVGLALFATASAAGLWLLRQARAA